MLKVIGKALLLVALGQSVWVEWSIIRHAGILWGLFFSMFFVPFALSAILAFIPAKQIE